MHVPLIAEKVGDTVSSTRVALESVVKELFLLTRRLAHNSCSWLTQWTIVVKYGRLNQCITRKTARTPL